VLREAAELDANNATGLCVDTSTMSAVAVADEIIRRCGGWPTLIVPRRPEAPPRPPAWLEPSASTAAMPVLFLCGATGVGKSSVGFQIYMGAATAAYCCLHRP
jgi:hypothetical protein